MIKLQTPTFHDKTRRPDHYARPFVVRVIDNGEKGGVAVTFADRDRAAQRAALYVRMGHIAVVRDRRVPGSTTTVEPKRDRDGQLIGYRLLHTDENSPLYGYEAKKK